MVDRGRTRSSQAAVSIAVVLLLVPAVRHSYLKYEDYVERTIHRTGNVWPDGEPVGADFVQFAGVAEAWQRGRIDELYASSGRQNEFMTLAAELDRPYPYKLQFNYPPFFAWLLRPLAPLDYLSRFAAWTLIQLSFAVVALAFWRRDLPFRVFLFVAVVLFVSPPVVINLVTGQTAFIGLASLSGTLFLLNRQRDFAAGLVLSLLFYKPTLGVVLGPLLVAAGRWRAVLGAAVGGMMLAAASAAVSLQACRDYPKMGGELVVLAMGYPDFFVRHYNLLGFVATALGRTPDEFNWVRRAIVVVPIAVLFVMTAKAWCVHWRPGTLRWSAGASAVLLTTFVATPYLFNYDAMIAAAAAAYSIRTWDVRPAWHRWYILLCIGVAWFFLAGGIPLMTAMQERMNVRLQLAPIAIAAWAVLEARWASSRAEPTNAE